MRRSFVPCSVAFLLIGCSNSGSAVTDNMAIENLEVGNLVVENSVEAGATPAPPTHNYAFKDSDSYGALYGYLGAISEEDQKKGVATPSVVRFRYTGFWQGAHHLQFINDNGAVVDNEECSVPCVVIKETDGSGQVRRVGYSSESIIGMAFDDAMNGQLRRSPEPGTVSGAYRFTGGNPNDAANWKPISPPRAPAQSDSESPENLTAENLVVENSVF